MSMPTRRRLLTSVTIGAIVGQQLTAATAQPRQAARRSTQPIAAPTEPFDLDAMMARMASVPERRALFREEKRLAALSQPLVSSGWLYYRRPALLEKRTQEPVVERLMVDGDRVDLDTVDEGHRSFDLSQAPELRTLVEAIRAPLAGNLAALQRDFQVSLSGAPSAWQLVLSPRDARVARFLRQVSLSGAGTDVLGTVSVQANGDVFAMQIRPLA